MSVSDKFTHGNWSLVTLDAPELSFQIVTAEEQGGWPAVRAVVGVVAEGALGDEGGDLLLRQRIAGAHSRVAGHPAQEIVEQNLTRRQAVLGHQGIDGVLQDLRGLAPAPDGR